MNLQDIESYIGVRTGMLATVYGAKENQARCEVFIRHLKNVPLSALKKAFDKAEIAFEKMPSVKKVGELCSELMPSQTWRYNFTPGTDKQGVVCLIDPDPDCDVCREPWSKHPHEKCSQVVNKLDARHMHKPQDCPEGRAFLAKLAEVRDSARAHKWLNIGKVGA